MEKKDFKTALELLSKMFDLKKDMEKLAQKDEEECDESKEEVDDEEKYLKELMNEYDSIMTWAFGNKYDEQTKRKSLAKYKELHPTLAIPRVFLSDMINPETHVVCLFIDLVPLYNVYKNSSK